VRLVRLLDLQAHLHLVAHQETTVSSGVPGQAGLPPVNRRLGLERSFSLPRDPSQAKVRHRQDHALRDAPDGEIAFDVVGSPGSA
jgi:hypothetical protein